MEIGSADPAMHYTSAMQARVTSLVLLAGALACNGPTADTGFSSSQPGPTSAPASSSTSTSEASSSTSSDSTAASTGDSGADSTDADGHGHGRHHGPRAPMIPARSSVGLDIAELALILCAAEIRGGKMSKKQPEVHTTPNPNGKGWVNQSGGEIISNHRTKAPAVARGRGEAKSQETEHVIHNTNGQIGQKNSYGSDPFPPRDKK